MLILCAEIRRAGCKPEFLSHEIGMWKKLIKGWTVSFEVWSELSKWTEKQRTASRLRRQTG